MGEQYSDFHFVDESTAEPFSSRSAADEPHITNHSTTDEHYGDEMRVRRRFDRMENIRSQEDLPLIFELLVVSSLSGLTSLALLHQIPASSVPSERSFSRCNLFFGEI